LRRTGEESTYILDIEDLPGLLRLT